MIKPHWKFSRFLDTHFLAVEGSHFGSGSRILFHRRQCTGSQPGQNGADFGVRTLDSHGICHRCRVQYIARPVVGDWMGAEPWPKANIVVPEVEHTCTPGRGRVIDFAVNSDSMRPFWRRITPEYNSPRKPHIGVCLQFTRTPTQVRVRQVCFPETCAFPKTAKIVVPSRKSKTRPEEPIKKEVKFVCKAEHWDSAMQSECKTRSGLPRVVSQSIGLTATRNETCGLGIRFQEFMQTAEECGSEIPFAHRGFCTKTLSHQAMPQQARKLVGICDSAYH